MFTEGKLVVKCVDEFKYSNKNYLTTFIFFCFGPETPILEKLVLNCQNCLRFLFMPAFVSVI